ncbi:hypothetical protein CR513_46885, partial [Mucuna pruriens]
MTKQGSNENSSCKNCTNSAWKPMRTLGSTNPKERVPSRPESISVQFTFKAYRRMNTLAAPSRSMGIRLSYSMK